jgi:hypothetical protein
MRRLTTDDNFESIKSWLDTNLKDNKSFIPCKEELLSIELKDFSKSKGIYFWFMRPDGYNVLSKHVTIKPVEPKYTKVIDDIKYDLVYLGTTGTGKQGKNDFYGRLDWHINQTHRESTIKQKESALSTLRTGLGSLLADDLIIPNTETIINNFMKTFMRVFCIEHPDNKILINDNEEILITELKPLLNLMQNSNSWKTAIDNPTKSYKSRRNSIEFNTKIRLGFQSISDNSIIKHEIKDSESNHNLSIIKEHKFKLNNQDYLLSWHDKPRLTKNGIEQVIRPLLIEYITKMNLPIQVLDNRGNYKVTYTLVGKILRHFSVNTSKTETKPNVRVNVTSDNIELIKTINKEHFYIPSKLGAKTLIILNCSSNKSEGGLDNNNVKDFFDKDISPYNNFIKIRNHLINHYNTRIVNPNQLKEAYLRYDGGGTSWIYNNVNWDRAIDLQRQNKLEIIILSALYGVIEFNYPIPEYDLTINMTINDWGDSINDVIDDYIEKKKISNIFNCISTPYSSLVKNIRTTPLSQGSNQKKLALWINSIIDSLA